MLSLGFENEFGGKKNDGFEGKKYVVLIKLLFVSMEKLFIRGMNININYLDPIICVEV